MAFLSAGVHGAGLPPGADHAVGSLGKRGGGDDRQAAGLEDLSALLDMGPGEADDERHRHVDLLDGLHDPLGDPVAAVDAGEDVDEHRLDLLVGEDESEGLGDTRSAEHTSELQSLMRISYAVFFLKKKIHTTK